MGAVGDGWFPGGFEGCADGCRFSMRGRLLALLMKRRELGSGIYIPPLSFCLLPRFCSGPTSSRQYSLEKLADDVHSDYERE